MSYDSPGCGTSTITGDPRGWILTLHGRTDCQGFEEGGSMEGDITASPCLLSIWARPVQDAENKGLS